MEKVFLRVTGMPTPSVMDAFVTLDEAGIVLKHVQFASDPKCLFGEKEGEIVRSDDNRTFTELMREIGNVKILGPLFDLCKLFHAASGDATRPVPILPLILSV